MWDIIFDQIPHTFSFFNIIPGGGGGVKYVIVHMRDKKKQVQSFCFFQRWQVTRLGVQNHHIVEIRVCNIIV